jgi:uncharacterized membrane-anchored protein
VKRAIAGGLGALGLLMAGAPAGADAPTPQQRATQGEMRAASRAADAARLRGPRDIALAGEATLHLPADMAFIPAAEANRFLIALGNTADPHRLGVVVSNRADQNWMAIVRWVHDGHVPDAGAREWQPEALLQDLRAGAQRQNKDRVARGIPPFDIIGWIEPPGYDPVNHRLIWSVAGRTRGSQPGAPQTVNYNTYVLGREGYISIDMLTTRATIVHDKRVARALLSDIAFAPTKRYDDFNPATDRLAAYGLAALVGVAAAKKLGLLATIGVFALDVWKFALVLALAGWALAKRLVAHSPGSAELAADSSETDQSPE